MNKLISIIIPIYNCGEYVITCLESIKNQAYRNFEIVLVDDCGQDNSIKIAEDYLISNGLKYIIFKNNKNMGVSATRNNGIKVCSGELIAFVDSDDVLSNNYLSSLYSSLEQTGGDYVYCDYERFTNDAEINTELTDNNTSYTLLENSDFYKQPGFCWGSLVKKNIIIENNIYFANGLPYGEDALWLTTYKAFCNKIVKCSTTKYFYRINAASCLSNCKSPLWTATRTFELFAKTTESIAYYQNNIKCMSELIKFRRSKYNCLFSELQTGKLPTKTFPVCKIKKCKLTYKAIKSSMLSTKNKVFEYFGCFFPTLEYKLIYPFIFKFKG